VANPTLEALRSLSAMDPAEKGSCSSQVRTCSNPSSGLHSDKNHEHRLPGTSLIRTTCKPHHRQVTTCRQGIATPPPQAGKGNSTGILLCDRPSNVLTSRWVEPPASRSGKTRSQGSKGAYTPGRTHKWNYPTELTSGTVAHHG